MLTDIENRKRSELAAIFQHHHEEAVYNAAILKLEAERDAYSRIRQMQIPRWLDVKLSMEQKRIENVLAMWHRKREELLYGKKTQSE